MSDQERTRRTAGPTATVEPAPREQPQDFGSNQDRIITLKAEEGCLPSWGGMAEDGLSNIFVAVNAAEPGGVETGLGLFNEGLDEMNRVIRLADPHRDEPGELGVQADQVLRGVDAYLERPRVALGRCADLHRYHGRLNVPRAPLGIEAPENPFSWTAHLQAAMSTRQGEIQEAMERLPGVLAMASAVDLPDRDDHMASYRSAIALSHLLRRLDLGDLDPRTRIWLLYAVSEQLRLPHDLDEVLIGREQLLDAAALESGLGESDLEELTALADAIAASDGEWPSNAPDPGDLSVTHRGYLIDLLAERRVERTLGDSDMTAMQALTEDDPELAASLRAGTGHVDTAAGLTPAEQAAHVAGVAGLTVGPSLIWGMATSIPILGAVLKDCSGDEIERGMRDLRMALGMRRAEAEASQAYAGSAGATIGMWSTAKIKGLYAATAALQSAHAALSASTITGEDLDSGQQFLAGLGAVGITGADQVAKALAALMRAGGTFAYAVDGP